jgi:hypothetical protein
MLRYGRLLSPGRVERPLKDLEPPLKKSRAAAEKFPPPKQKGRDLSRPLL